MTVDDGLKCGSCQTLNEPFVVFCVECGAPIQRPQTPDATTTAPAEEKPFPGKLMRRPRLIVVIGLWMLCFPSMILSAIISIDIIVNYRKSSNIVFFWLAGGTFLLTAFILFRVTKNYLTLPAVRKSLSADYTDDSE